MGQGVGVGIVNPILFSLVADMTIESERGTAYGILCFTQSMGGTVGGWLSTVISAHSSVQLLPGFSVAGWRVSCFGLCLTGTLLGLAMMCFGRDPKPIDDDDGNERPTLAAHIKVLRIPTFQVIVAQGCFGNLPWAAWNFSTLWLELNCFSNTMAATIVASYTFAQAVGQPFGGWLGDWWARRSPDYGRPLLSVLSVGLGIPCVFAFFVLLPQGQEGELGAAVPYIALAFAFGFAMSWTLAGTNAPIYSEIVPPAQRTLVFGMDAAFEGTAGSFGAPIAGWVAQHVFNYDTDAADASSAGGGCDLANAHSLGRAVTWTMMVPWAICMAIYCLLLVTYKKDRLRKPAGDGLGRPLLQ